jgi:hypothetical protein
VREGRGCSCLALEPERVGARPEQLQRDAAAELEVLGEEDVGHRALAEALQDPVPARDDVLAHASTLCLTRGAVTVD